MISRNALLLLAMFRSAVACAQVVNIEQARVNSDSIGWNVGLDLNFFRQEFDDDLTTLTGRFSAQKKDARVFLLVLSDAGYSRSQTEVFTDYKMGHVRASVKVNPRIRWEVFAQAQDNKPLGIRFRSLTGTGPRIRLLVHENGRLYGGLTAMLEYEWSTSGVADLNVWRSSNYLSFNWDKDGKFGWSSTLYVQPRFTDVHDYRISGQHAVIHAATQRFHAKLEFTHSFDSKPPSEGLYRSRITTLGLSYVLD